MQYRPEIDGLRSIAVISVMLFHAGFGIASGGFVGVDVFFVISGYLISAILIDDIDNGRYSILRFYDRRARRILPALFFMMLVCLPISWFVFLPEDLARFAKSVVAVVTFSSNLHFSGESGYFDSAAELKPLLHTWSLSVEEQYYIFFPLLLAFLWPRQRFLLPAFISLFILSICLAEWRVENAPSSAFYWLSSRIWEFLAGVFAALVIYRSVDISKFQNRQIMSFTGLLLVVVPVFIYHKDTPFPGMYAMPPVLGTVLLIIYTDASTLVHRMLANRIMVATGLLSYSAYLWHQPIFAFFRYQQFEITPWIGMALCMISFFIAYFSWRYIESPFRNSVQFSRKSVFTMAGVFFVLFVSVGLVGKYTNGYERIWLSGKSDSEASLYYMIQDSPSNKTSGLDSSGIQDNGRCQFNLGRIDAGFEARVTECYKEFGSGIFVIGDSHAVDLYGLLTSIEGLDFVVGVAADGCRAHANNRKCYFSEIERYLEKNAYYFSAVIYEQAAFYLLQDKYGQKGSRSMLSTVPLTGHYDGITVDMDHVKAVSVYLGRLALNSNVVWFGPRLEPHITDPVIMNMGCGYQYKLRDGQDSVFLSLDDYIRNFVGKYPGVKFISQNDMFQFRFPEDFMTCQSILWTDGDHFSADGEKYFSKRFDQSILGAND